MSRLRIIFTRMASVAAMVIVGCGAASDAKPRAIVIPHSDVSVFPPKGWVLNSHIASATPSLNFELPHPEQGGYAALPALEIELLVGARAPRSFSDYFTKQFGRFVLPPRYLTIGGHPAVEFAYFELVIHDFAGGSGSTSSPVAHEVLLKRSGVFIRCLLYADPDNYSPYRAAPAILCGSLASRQDFGLRSNNLFKPNLLRGSA